MAVKQQTNIVCGRCFDDERNRIIACDYGNNRLSVWSADSSQFIQAINVPSSSSQYNPISVCVDQYANSHRFLVGTEQSQILVFDARNENKVLQTIGSKGDQPGQFDSSIRGVCVNEIDGTLLATDWNNHRIQIFWKEIWSLCFLFFFPAIFVSLFHFSLLLLTPFPFVLHYSCYVLISQPFPLSSSFFFCFIPWCIKTKKLFV